MAAKASLGRNKGVGFGAGMVQEIHSRMRFCQSSPGGNFRVLAGPELARHIHPHIRAQTDSTAG